MTVSPPDPSDAMSPDAKPSDAMPADPIATDADQSPTATPTPTTQVGSQPGDPLRRSRASQAWVATIVFAILLVLLLVFVLQNTERVEISYFAWDFSMPLSVAILLAAVIGVLLAAIAGTYRILQLRRRVRRDQKT